MLARVPNSTYPSFNLLIITEEEKRMILLLIINEDKRILNKKKCQDLLSFVTFKEL